MAPSFKPLMSELRHGQFEDLRRRLAIAGVSNVAHTFVPVMPEKPRLPRLMFVGKATRDFASDDLASYAEALETGVELLSNLPKGISGFWQFARTIAERTLKLFGLEEPRSHLTEHCAWSNLAKIGDTRGNPTPFSLSLQGELCREMLSAEIADLIRTVSSSCHRYTPSTRSSARCLTAARDGDGTRHVRIGWRLSAAVGQSWCGRIIRSG